MTFVPAQDVVEVHQRATLYGQKIENVHHVMAGMPVDQSTVLSIASTAHDAWKTNILPQLTNGYSLRETYCVDLSSQTGPTAEAITTPTPEGFITVAGAPANAALCLSLRTSGRGRSARGRQYLSGLQNDGYEENAWKQAIVDDVLAAWNDYVAELSAAGLVLVVVSRYENKQPRSQALVQPVTGTIITDRWIDSQRRRLTGRGQ